MVEKAINVEAKTILQPSSKIEKIDSKYLRGYRPLVKKDKDNANWEHWDGDKDKDKAKSHNPSSINNQPQAQLLKKNKFHESCQRDYLATGVNATKIAKKDKNKTKDLNHIRYYTYKQKGHYINQCPKKSKN